jgi:hypothetical protein
MRVNVYRYGTEGYEDTEKTLDGWFDSDKAEFIEEAKRWNGHNMVSVHTVDQFAHQGLYRTAKGRWVLNCWSQRQGSEQTYEFVTDEQARTWLLKNESDDLAEKYFGEVEEERGPGRPEVGKPINVRLGDELQAKVDALAAERGQKRAETIRDLVAQALGL